MSDGATAPRCRLRRRRGPVQYRDRRAATHGDGRGLNACVECCDRHASADAIALDWIDAGGQHHRYTFAQMKALSAHVANLLVAQGVKPGDVVAGLLPRTPELVATILGTWRAGAVYQPLFTAFGPKAIEHRLRMSDARLVVTNVANRAKLDEIAGCPAVATVREPGEALPEHDIDFRAALDAQSDAFEPVLRKGTDLFMMMSTSGTTGCRKACRCCVRCSRSARTCATRWTCVPATGSGTSPIRAGRTASLRDHALLLGHATTLYEGGFTVDSTYDVIERLGITSLAGSPTAYRMLMAAGTEAAARLKGKLRVVSSAGEPLNPEVVRWFDAALGAPIYDHYGQTELGMVVNNHHGLAHVVHAGSAGFAMPATASRCSTTRAAARPRRAGQPRDRHRALAAAVVPRLLAAGHAGDRGRLLPDRRQRRAGAGRHRELHRPRGRRDHVVRLPDRPVRRGKRADRASGRERGRRHRRARCGAHGDRQGVRRAVERLRRHAGAGRELSLHVKRRLSAHAYPRAIDFVDALPKTSGKIQRFVLRKMEAERPLNPEHNLYGLRMDIKDRVF